MKKNMFEKINNIEIKKFLNQDWYVQGFNAVPIFLNPAVWSGVEMKKELGFSYSNFFATYKNGYGEVGYLNSDFKRIWKIVKNKIKNDPEYIEKVRVKYISKFRNHENLFKIIDRINLRGVSDEKLVDIFQQCMKAQIDSVGVAHIVESIGMELEKELGEKLFKEINLTDSKIFNKYISTLTTPTADSFIAKEEKELLKIAKSKSKDQLLKKHLKKYFWIMNSYAGSFDVDIKFLKKRINSLAKLRKENFNSKIKKDLIKKLKLSQDTLKNIKLVDFVTIFQDERKSNILKTISYFDMIIGEIYKRTNVPTKLLRYICVSDFENLKSIEDIKRMKNTLKRRISGVYFMVNARGEYGFIGKEYDQISEFRKKISANETKKIKDLHGASANLGKAIGRVKICKDISSIEKFSTGDVLVASMTRPEFIHAMKKSVAIITDEGGITCHAAIVSRELGIPCIIGTKIATKVLKDGDLVEVNANHGIIKILK